jgi:hypothetical protein
MSLLLVSYRVQVLLIVHCIKSGRNQLWIWVLAMLPIASIIAYVAAELLPDCCAASNSHPTRRRYSRVCWIRRLSPLPTIAAHRNRG